MKDCAKLVKALREHAEWMGPNNYELPIAMYDDLLKAADVIEELSMKLHGDEAAIAGMKREIERAVVNATDVAALAQNRFDRLLAENDDLRKRLAETGKTLSWISTKDWLPECEPGAEVGNITFRLKSGTIYTGCFGRGGLQRDKYFRNWTGSGEGWDAEYVTHWVKLPDAEVKGQ